MCLKTLEQATFYLHKPLFVKLITTFHDNKIITIDFNHVIIIAFSVCPSAPVTRGSAGTCNDWLPGVSVGSLNMGYAYVRYVHMAAKDQIYFRFNGFQIGRGAHMRNILGDQGFQGTRWWCSINILKTPGG